jgi:hypothetical protein
MSIKRKRLLTIHFRKECLLIYFYFSVKMNGKENADNTPDLEPVDPNSTPREIPYAIEPKSAPQTKMTPDEHFDKVLNNSCSIQ